MGLPLTPGQRGPEIADLRARLTRWQRAADVAAPLGEGEVFDADTEAVVRAFQRDRHLPADAVVGPETWQALVDADHVLGGRLLWHSATPMRGDDVLELQHRLNQLGFDAGTEDGIFGPLARDAVMEFQTDVGLEVDGIVGTTTLEALHRLHRGHLAAGVGTRVREARSLAQIARRGITGLSVMLDAVDVPAGPGEAVEGAEVPYALVQRLAGRLAAHGARVARSCGPRSRPPPSARARTANLLGVDLVVSIGLNRLDTPAASGVATYHYGSLRYVSEAGQALAGHLLDACLASGLGPDCRAHPMTWTLLRETRMPAVVVEPGFASSEADLARLRDPAVQDRLAGCLVDGVRRFLDHYSPG